MSSLKEIYALQYASPEFYERVQVSVVQTAKYILIESADTPNHVNRLAWADATIVSPSRATTQVMIFVVTDPAIVEGGANATDEQINAAVAAAVNPLADAGIVLKARGE